MEETGFVTEIKDTRARVLVESPDECHECEFSRFCRGGEEGREILCINEINAEVGDKVEIGTSTRNVITATSLNFVIPLVFLIAGVVLGISIWGSELGGFITGMALMALYFFAYLFIDKKLIARGIFLPEIKKIIEKNDSENSRINKG